jgi:hypothetical protein
MGAEAQSFRDHLVSLLQSAADEAARTMGATPNTDLLRAVERVGDLVTRNQPLPKEAPAGIVDTAWDCAREGHAYLAALASGDSAQMAQADAVYKFNKCDPGWASTLKSYVVYFGIDGKRRTIPYIHAADIGNTVVPMKAAAKVALIADWGTGTDVAKTLLQKVAAQCPDVLIHLGDIYYSGTAQECDVNFERIVNSVLNRATTRVYTLSGNHDMYSGGAGFYGLLKTLNAEPLRQPASFFCLRSADNLWQFVAMDTGKHDYSPSSVTTVLTSLEQDEEAWLAARIAEFSGKTILLSHHQLFSALAQIGPKRPDGSLVAYNPYLAVSFKRFTDAAPGRIAAWFWGHEHALSVYQPYLGLDRGRCIGHGAVPIFTSVSEAVGPAEIVDPPRLRRDVHLGSDGPIYLHGFTLIQLGADGSATATYYDSSDNPNPLFAETF